MTADSGKPLGTDEALLDRDALRVLADGLDHPEAVCWSRERQSILAGGEAGQLYLCPLKEGHVRELLQIPGGSLLGIAVDGQGDLYVCDTGNHCVQRIDRQGVEPYAQGIEYPNYPAFGPDGTLWVSDSGAWNRASGSLLRIEPDGSLERLSLPPLSFANGLAIDDESLYVVESAGPAVLRLDLTDPSRPEEVVRLPRTVPDGLALDEKGGLWIACFQPNRVYRFDPDGSLEVMLDDWSGEEFISPTNVAFAGDELDLLVLASLCGRTLKAIEGGFRGRPLHYPDLSGYERPAASDADHRSWKGGIVSPGLEGSRRLYERSQRVLSGGVTSSFRRAERPVPLFLGQAQGAEVTDVDGNVFIDFVCGFGPVILGHNDARVTAAVSRSPGLQQLGGQQLTEVELAEELCRSVPAFEQVRFGVSGSEAVHAALRLARASTGRQLVLKFAGHYHGWLDGVFSATAGWREGADSAGQTESQLRELAVIQWNDEGELRRALARTGERLAAVIMEPLPCNQGVIYPRPGYLELARQLTREYGALLVFDEVITGFRIGLGGAQARFGVIPDLAVVAKAMANGFPISAFGGPAELMELVARNEVVHAGTYNGGGTSISAAIATLRGLTEDRDVYMRMESLGKRLMTGLAETAAEHGHRLVTQGPGPVFFAWFLEEGEVRAYRDHLRADSERYARFAARMLDCGIRIIPSGRWYLSAAHDERDVDRALDAADDAFRDLC